ncbi:GNAT family N-acetyltransferase [Mycobacterium ulcerans]|uniref:GNAT family N-acetyltransferase n=1 Tax=Mycobacterium ulcerans TaxID=1809 RepID=UPI0012DE2C38|nr:GNAT family N-acetyltransferase [Mycobacterium ulcerans]MEB3971245.1 GNAT family N-acetyltransferase [Mycobacterium ulcerans]MEB3979510.1 GNAT family N-acetyltransferase [Mycobacterium ulcerans]MEB4008777.1 GNAT family N-acetyltransferase [Mycobacterium ulcerans]MEB4418353.1 GNAT family N-acetyltransferase [Mycobacterium ulcerans]MEB4436506.1 GNAT family N-acetyltransferase [Mycobacterium ulcerans]
MPEATQPTGAVELRFVPVALGDPLAQPLLTELAAEYAQRYGVEQPAVLAWLQDGAALEFAPPDGGMLIGLRDGRPVTGGAFCRHDPDTAELKRIWTHCEHRRRGHARALLARLEGEIAARGYRKVYLVTGNRQPEAEELYRACGYTRLPAPQPSEGPVLPIAFGKALP